MNKMTSINLVDAIVEIEQGRELINAWAEKKKLAPLNYIGQTQVLYPYYYGETLIEIKRIFPLSPRRLTHRWLLDAITGRPFMLSNNLEAKPNNLSQSNNLLEPVIDHQGAVENIKGHLPRLIMRYYKYFFTPTISADKFDLFYIKVWLFNFTDNNNSETFMGVNSFSGNIMEVEKK